MPRSVESPEHRPAFPKCTVRGHAHELRYLETVTQTGTGDKGYLLECPGGTYQFFFLPTVWRDLSRMARYRRPRFCWTK